MKKLITGIHHVSLKTNGLEAFEKTVDFYTGVLGLESLRSWERDDGSKGIMINTGNSLVEINSTGGPPSQADGNIRHFALSTGDVDAVVERVRAAGYEITTEPRDASLPTDPPFEIRIAFCTGPVGEVIEFFCEK